MAKSLPVLEMLGFLIAVAMVLISSLLFMAENRGKDESTGLLLRPGALGLPGDDLEVSPFQSIPDAFWIR